MNLIVLMLDTLRQDHVSFHNRGRPVFDGVPACRTPNIDRFAEQSVVFNNMYPEALPTIPARNSLFAGVRTLVGRPWQPLDDADVSIAEILGPNGYVCGLVSDTYHYRAPGMNYHRSFHSYEWIRGQEYDPYVARPPKADINDYVNENYDADWRARVAQFLANTERFSSADDWFAPQVADRAVEWLKDCRGHERIFFWMDSFDPHEPWDPPAEFDVYTDPNCRGPRLILPMGGIASEWANQDEIRHIQGLYAGEVAAVDAALGRVLETLEEEGYYDDSIVVVMGDHGHPLADHGKFLKGVDRLYNELLKVPFMFRMPGGQFGGRQVEAVAQFHDFLPTVLDLMGLANCTMDMPGRSFRPVIEGDTDEHRARVVIGYRDGPDRVIRDKRWSLIVRPGEEENELYDLDLDPAEKINLVGDEPDLARELAREFGSIYYGMGWPGEQKMDMPLFVRRAVGDHVLQGGGRHLIEFEGAPE